MKKNRLNNNKYIGWVGVGSKPLSAYASTQPHAYAYGQLEVGHLTACMSLPLALHCKLCPTPCSPGNAPRLSPPELQYPSAKTGQQQNTKHSPLLEACFLERVTYSFITIVLLLAYYRIMIKAYTNHHGPRLKGENVWVIN